MFDGAILSMRKSELLILQKILDSVGEENKVGFKLKTLPTSFPASASDGDEHVARGATYGGAVVSNCACRRRRYKQACLPIALQHLGCRIHIYRDGPFSIDDMEGWEI